MKLHECMRQARLNKGITQEQMAELTGISKNHLSAIERGKYKCTAQTLIQYADICGISLDRMLHMGKYTEHIIPEFIHFLQGFSEDDQRKLLNLIKELINIKQS